MIGHLGLAAALVENYFAIATVANPKMGDCHAHWGML